jgi:hypothetical protein
MAASADDQEVYTLQESVLVQGSSNDRREDIELKVKLDDGGMIDFVPAYISDSVVL